MAWRSGQSYLTDLRNRVLADIDCGSPAKAVAGLFRVSVSYKALARRRAIGETEARPQRNRWTLKSFANPAVTIARALSDTFAGIRPIDVPAFIVVQFAGALAASMPSGWLFADRQGRHAAAAPSLQRP
jgi:hypothetical protein